MVRARPVFRMLALSLFGLGAFTGMRAQTGLEGFWNLRLPNGTDGTFRDVYLRLEQKGETLSGGIVRRPNELPLTGTYKDGAVHLVTVPPPPPPPPPGAPPRPAQRPTTYDGTFAEGKLTLHMQGRNGLVEGVAERVSEGATQPPKALPLPALHEVPDNGLARTPPMGWNSWNKFAGRIDDAAVRGMADAMVSSGMRDAGYVYINIDDTWEMGRDASGNITTNKKFPNMKALADYVHARGLKIGIYSGPGPKTCAGYEGSFGHVEQDARQYAAWGFDYLKYDLCSAREIYNNDAPTLQAIYQQMGDALLATQRPIVYSLCEYGWGDVWTGWGTQSGGNLWRTTGDISDTWESMDRIGWSQIKLAPFATTGHWNDPDMLEIGNGGMTADEYRTHMSLWSLLAAPLIAGNDLRSMSDETKSILMNREVIAIDQDPQYKPVQSLSSNGSIEVLARPLHDGSIVVGLFNRGDTAADAGFSRASLLSSLPGYLPGSLPAKGITMRDLWKHQSVAWDGESFKANVPRHGVLMLKLTRQQP